MSEALLRARLRHRRLALSSAASLFSKGVSAATVLWSARMTIGYLGSERYGLWMAVSSAVTFLSFADLGLGNGLVSEFSHAEGRRDSEGMRRSLSSGFFMLLGMALLLALATLLLGRFLPWARIFNVASDLAGAEAGPALQAFALCFAAGLPLGVAYKLHSGLQEGYVVHLWQSLGNLMALGCIALSVRLKLGLPALVLSLSGPPLLAQLLSWARIGLLRPELLPRAGLVDKERAWKLLSKGAMFVGFSLMAPLAFYSDTLVLAQVLGAQSVAGYAVCSKLFNLATLLIGMVSSQLWPAYGEAAARGDIEWLESTLRRSLIWGFWAVALPSAAVALAAPWLLKLWLGEQAPIQPQASLLWGLAYWSVVSSLGFSIGNFLAGCNMLKVDLAASAAMTLLALGLKIAFTRAWGMPGVVWGLNLAFTLSFPLYAVFIPRLLRRMRLKGGTLEDSLWLT